MYKESDNDYDIVLGYKLKKFNKPANSALGFKKCTLHTVSLGNK